MAPGFTKDEKIYKEAVSWSIEDCTLIALLGYTFSYFIYIVAGGFCFLLIEGQKEDDLFKKLELAQSSIMRRHPNVTGEVLKEFVAELASLGVDGLQAVNNSEEKWNLSQSVFFCVTLLTTIGYGHISPITHLGKSFCILYSGFGIPFTVVLFASWVERLMGVARSAQRVMCKCARGVLRELSVRLLFIVLIAISISVIFIFLPAYVFQFFEDGWTYLDSVYFCFISITTVGLGDFVPAMSAKIHHREIYRFAVAIYLLAGVISVTFLVALAAEFRGCMKRIHVEEPSKQQDSKYPSYGSVAIEKTRLLFEDVHYEVLKDCL